MQRILAPVGLALAAVLAAQDDSAAWRLLPRDPAIVIAIDGPGRMAKTLGETRMGKVIGSSALAKRLLEQVGELEGRMKELGGEAGFDVEKHYRELLRYEGRLLVAIGQIRWDKLWKASLTGQRHDPEPGDIGPVTLVLTPDGKTDLPGLCEGFARRAEKAGGVREFDAGGIRFREPSGAAEAGFTFTLPQMVDGCLFLAMGIGLQKELGALLSAPAGQRFVPSEAVRAGALAVEFSAGMVRGFVGGLTEHLGEAEPDLGPVIKAVVEGLGLDAIGALRWSLRQKDDVLISQSEIALPGGARGLFAALATTARRPRLLDLAPLHLDEWGVSPIRLPAVYETIAKAWDALGDKLPMAREDGEREFAELFKVRLKEDLLDHMGGEVLAITTTAQAADPGAEDPMAAVGDVALGFELRDPAAFGKSWDKLLRSRGLHTARKSEEYQGVRVFTQKVLGAMNFDYAVTERLFLVAFGEKGRQYLRAVIDEEAARKAGKAPDPLPPHVQARLAHAPQGWNGIAVNSLSVGLETAAGMIENSMAQLAMEEAPWAEELAEDLRSLAGDLRRAKVDRGVGFARWTADELVSRTIW